MIVGTNITKRFSGEPILQEVDFKIGNGRKIGIVGRNGCGKSTLLKIISNEIQFESGKLQIQEETIAHIPQEFSYKDELVGEFTEKLLNETWETYKIELLVDQLNFQNYDPYQQIKTLSEGQKMKLKMIETLLKDPTTILIDEPTNHLDIEGIQWFEKYIKQLKLTVVMISHDREFLNNTVDEIWEIENKKILRFVGNYDNYKIEKSKLIDSWDEEYTRFLKRKEQLQTLLENSRKIKGKRRGNAVKAAKKRIEREITSQEKEKYETKVIKQVKFDTEVTNRKLMIRFDNVGVKFGNNEVFNNLSFEIRGGDKVWLFGPNGAGKTTSVKLITKEISPTTGEIKIGENIKIGYFAQKLTHLNYDKRLQEEFLTETTCSYEKSFGYLKNFMFEKDDLIQPVKTLSPGQRARFAFAIFAYNDYDLLILDEPTNHLDIETKEVIEKSLSEYKGTLLLVSHDRYFVESVNIQRILNLRQGQLNEY